jgi:ankyrin repeat protein
MKKNQVNKLPEDVIRAIYRKDLNVINQWQSKETINSIDKDGRSAIFHAILIASIDVTKQLLKESPNLNLKDRKGWYPLHYAAQNYLVEIANLLIDDGADIESKDDYGNTPLWRATFSSQGKGDMIKLLISNGANPDNRNDSNISPIKLANSIANYNVKQFFPPD